MDARGCQNDKGVPVDRIAAAVTPIAAWAGRSSISSATGFFYEDRGNLYLVTNRHVVIGEKEHYFPDKLTLRLHSNKDFTVSRDSDVPLYASSGQPAWMQHKTADVDIVALRLNKSELSQRFFLAPFTKADLIPPDVAITIGEDLLMLGYPLGFYDKKLNLPIIRPGALATIYPVGFEGNLYVLMAAALHHGDSGSPVITKPSNWLRKWDGKVVMQGGAPKKFLVGVLSAEMRQVPGLAAVWFARLIEEIIVGGEGQPAS